MINGISSVLKKRKEIAFAYLYGSFAKGKEGRESDIDIAVFLKDSRPDPLYEAGLALEIEKKTRQKREVDVRILNNQPPFFVYQVLVHGKRIFTRDRKLAVNFEAQSFCRYFDFKPVLDQYDNAQKRRLLA